MSPQLSFELEIKTHYWEYVTSHPTDNELIKTLTVSKCCSSQTIGDISGNRMTDQMQDQAQLHFTAKTRRDGPDIAA